MGLVTEAEKIKKNLQYHKLLYVKTLPEHPLGFSLARFQYNGLQMLQEGLST